MIDSADFIAGLQKANIQFVTGVPDSLLKDIGAAFYSLLKPEQHVIASSEGAAVGLAMGHYLATSQPALVYMQNSGLGNTVNPIASLADPLVYAVPMVLLIGWRGELLDDQSQLKDEPQHLKQGRITLTQLETLGIPYVVIDCHTGSISQVLRQASEDSVARRGPVAIVVRKNTFKSFEFSSQTSNAAELSREDAIRHIVEHIPQDACVISTTGMASRELFEIRKNTGSGHQRDFLTVGGMGHASQIAAGIALSQPQRAVVCIDGDGAILMHAGSLSTSADCTNMLHFVLNNGAHDSVGGQPTKGTSLRFDKIAASFGYKRTAYAADAIELRDLLVNLKPHQGSCFIEVRCKRGSRADLGRPDRSPQENKTDFMDFLREKNEPSH